MSSSEDDGIPEHEMVVVTDPDIGFLFIDPKIESMSRILADYRQCFMANLRLFRYDEVPAEKLKVCIYRAILDYVRSCWHVRDGKLYVCSDAYTILKSRNWDCDALGDTSPREHIFNRTDGYLLHALGMKKMYELYVRRTR